MTERNSPHAPELEVHVRSVTRGLVATVRTVAVELDPELAANAVARDLTA